MRRVLTGVAVLGFAVFTGSVLAQAPAAGGQADAPLLNLQVYPKTSTRAAILNNMQAIVESLGVECNYCHVEQNGRFDYASDDKRPKLIARKMMGFRDKINVELPDILGKTDGTRVLCSTCHRGVPIPKQISEVVFDATAKAKDPAVGLAKFKELRALYYGGQSYDFSEGALIELSRRAGTTGARKDESMAYLQANLEFFPKSTKTYTAIAKAKAANGDRAGAIAAYQKVAELDPNDSVAKAELQLLKAQ